MSIIPLNASQPIAFTDLTMQYPFRDYMLRVGAYISPDVTDDSLAAYTMVLGDEGKIRRFTATSPAVTIPAEIAVNYEVGAELSIRQAGTGTLVLTTTGLTINGTVPSWAQHIEVKFRKVSSDEWDVV